MDFKTACENAIANKTEKHDYIKIAQYGKSAVKTIDGNMRWINDGQTISFDNPKFYSTNAEFQINGRNWQNIWFSQIHSYGVLDDLQTPILDEIVFKGQPACRIKDKYISARTFWDDVKDKKFKVEIIGGGFSLNLKNDLVNSLITDAIAKRKALPGKADKVVFDYIRQAVSNGKTDSVKGTLKNKTAYRFIEI